MHLPDKAGALPDESARWPAERCSIACPARVLEHFTGLAMRTFGTHQVLGQTSTHERIFPERHFSGSSHRLRSPKRARSSVLTWQGSPLRLPFGPSMVHLPGGLPVFRNGVRTDQFGTGGGPVVGNGPSVPCADHDQLDEHGEHQLHHDLPKDAGRQYLG